jgi:hypothetical protein
MPDATTARSANVISIDPLIDQRWKRYISDHPDALVFHHPAWLRTLQEAFCVQADSSRL